MNNSKKRIMNDLKVLRKNNIEFESIDTHTITCIIKGPKDTPYEKGSWKITIDFPNNYPFSSPSIGFLDKIYHPNKNEIRWAKLVVKTYNTSTKKGKGATVVDGKMIDEVHYKRAKALLEII